MITDLKINEENKKRYYEQGYWTEKTVNDIWNDRVAAHPDREYISDDMGVRLTYAEIDDKAARLASWLREQGIQNGDVVTFQMPPWSEFAILYVACLKVGAVIHPLAVTFNGEDLVYAMNLVESKAFIAPTFHHKTNFEDRDLLGGRAHPFSSDQCDRSSRQNGRCEIGHYAQRDLRKIRALHG